MCESWLDGSSALRGDANIGGGRAGGRWGAGTITAGKSRIACTSVSRVLRQSRVRHSEHSRVALGRRPECAASRRCGTASACDVALRCTALTHLSIEPNFAALCRSSWPMNYVRRMSDHAIRQASKQREGVSLETMAAPESVEGRVQTRFVQAECEESASGNLVASAPPKALRMQVSGSPTAVETVKPGAAGTASSSRKRTAPNPLC